MKDANLIMLAKKVWGIDASENKIWTCFKDVENQISTSVKEKQALLCWHKHKGAYLTFLIVWW